MRDDTMLPSIIAGKSLDDIHTLAIVSNQWGDEGKGKIVDAAAAWVDIIARGTGGANAGHTIYIPIDDKVMPLAVHLVPSGIRYDSEGKISILGNGMVVDPEALLQELAMLSEAGLTYNNLYLAHNAKLVLPQHIVLDKLRERASRAAGNNLGTTGRGIGPAYADYVARVGLTINDLLNRDIFVKKFRRNLDDKLPLLRGMDSDLVASVLGELPHASFVSSDHFFDLDAIVETYMEHGRQLQGMIRDTDAYMRENLGRRRMLLEGAQGLLLSVDHGTYPYVTSCDTSVRGLAEGVGLQERDIDVALGLVKAFFMTRVGSGPFPTEFGGEASAKWCGQGLPNMNVLEADQYAGVTVNDPNPFKQGIAIRIAGGEYGATTGRPRRTGWLDLPLLRYAARINGRNVVLTKVDVLSDCDEISICERHTYKGPDYRLGNRVVQAGDIFDVAPMDVNVLRYCEPVYTRFRGWKSNIRDVRSYDASPVELKQIINHVERSAGVTAAMISVGPEREQMIVRGV